MSEQIKAKEPFEEWTIRDIRDLPRLLDWVEVDVIPVITGIRVDRKLHIGSILEDKYALPEAKALEFQRAKDECDAIENYGYRQGTKTLERVDQFLDQLEARNSRWYEENYMSPAGEKAWAEANSRAAFVREDCQRWAAENPGKIVEAYKDAVSEGNSILAFLLKRYGREALAGEQFSNTRDHLEAAIRANYGPAYDLEMERINKLRGRSLAIRERMDKQIPPSVEQELRQRFGIHN